MIFPIVFFLVLISGKSVISTSSFPEADSERWDPKNHSNWSLLDHQNCGESYTDRIIGGKKAAMGQYPWMARLGYVGYSQSSPEYMCGGSLISKLYVLTAAHCVNKDSMSPYKLKKIRLGEHNVNVKDCKKNPCPKKQEFSPAKIIEHKKFHLDSMQNDIAMIMLNKPAILNDFVAPICLPYGSLMDPENFPKIMEVAGWGIYDIYNKKMNKHLTFVRVPVQDIVVCKNKLGSKMISTNGQICAGGEVGYDSCGGDSGGPLMAPYALDGPPKVYQFGIVSFGMIACGGDAPAIYTDTTYFLRWILDNIVA